VQVWHLNEQVVDEDSESLLVVVEEVLHVVEHNEQVFFLLLQVGESHRQQHFEVFDLHFLVFFQFKVGLYEVDN